METDQQQLISENTELSQQLLILKTKVNPTSTEADNIISKEDEKLERLQKDQMVTLLKRNHDVLLQKYETFRSQNQSLEKLAIEKENLYNEMKIESEKAQNKLYIVSKNFEEAKTKLEILEQKIRSLSEREKVKDDQIKDLKAAKDKFEG